MKSVKEPIPQDHPWKCPECGSKLRGVLSPPQRFCMNKNCDFSEEPGERKTKRTSIYPPGKAPWDDTPDLEGYRQGETGNSPYRT